MIIQLTVTHNYWCLNTLVVRGDKKVFTPTVVSCTLLDKCVAVSVCCFQVSLCYVQEVMFESLACLQVIMVILTKMYAPPCISRGISLFLTCYPPLCGVCAQCRQSLPPIQHSSFRCWVTNKKTVLLYFSVKKIFGFINLDSFLWINE